MTQAGVPDIRASRHVVVPYGDDGQGGGSTEAEEGVRLFRFSVLYGIMRLDWPNGR